MRTRNACLAAAAGLLFLVCAVVAVATSGSLPAELWVAVPGSDVRSRGEERVVESDAEPGIGLSRLRSVPAGDSVVSDAWECSAVERRFGESLDRSFDLFPVPGALESALNDLRALTGVRLARGRGPVRYCRDWATQPVVKDGRLWVQYRRERFPR